MCLFVFLLVPFEYSNTGGKQFFRTRAVDVCVKRSGSVQIVVQLVRLLVHPGEVA